MSQSKIAMSKTKAAISKFTLLLATSVGLSSLAIADNVINGAPSWSTPSRGQAAEIVEANTLKTVSGSAKSYTQAQIDDKFSAPDWLPQQHQAMPTIVQFGKKPKVWACASCHLASGTGHPESATLAGLSSSYIQSQMKAFADDTRLDYSGHMNRMAKELTEQEIIDVSDWFASLTTNKIVNVKEVSEVAQTLIDDTRMRLVVNQSISQSTTEDIAGRIIEIPQDRNQTQKRHPNSQFNSYVPLGSLARGKTIVETGGGKSTPCFACHGTNLKGSSIAPSIAGNFGIYTVRQLHGFKGGSRTGAQSALMTPVVAQLTDADIVDIAAYLSSLSPQ